MRRDAEFSHRGMGGEIYRTALGHFHLRTNLTLSYAAFPPCLPKSRASLSSACEDTGITPEGGRGDPFFTLFNSPGSGANSRTASASFQPSTKSSDRP